MTPFNAFRAAALSTALLLAGTFAAAADQAPAKETAKPYPLDYCIVSGDKLDGDMGKPITVVKNGQEFKLCCKGCITEIDKDPKKFEDKLAAAQKKDAKAGDTKDGAAKHDDTGHDQTDAPKDRHDH
ncbi:MAG: hypothetical protein H0W83_02145 [Planctomycetes bacterium]|nr:hypothetical protein [Planctomycetota bacterium]